MKNYKQTGNIIDSTIYETQYSGSNAGWHIFNIIVLCSYVLIAVMMIM